MSHGQSHERESRTGVNLSNPVFLTVAHEGHTTTQERNATAINGNDLDGSQFTYRPRIAIDTESPGPELAQQGISPRSVLELPYSTNPDERSSSPAETIRALPSLASGSPYSRPMQAADSPADSVSVYWSLQSSLVDLAQAMEAEPSREQRAEHEDIVELRGDCSPSAYLRFSSPCYIEQGALLQVEPFSDHIGGSVILVLKVSRDGLLQCLRVCRHEEMRGRDNEKSFWQTHSYVFDPNNYKLASFATVVAPRPQASIRVKLHEGFSLLPKCFVNYEHTWTVRWTSAKLREIGYLQDGEIENVLSKYRQALANMYLWDSL